MKLSVLKRDVVKSGIYSWRKGIPSQTVDCPNRGQWITIFETPEVMSQACGAWILPKFLRDMDRLAARGDKLTLSKFKIGTVLERGRSGRDVFFWQGQDADVRW